MVITARGEIKAYQFYPAVMHSAARLTYTEVAAVLANTKGPEAREARRPVAATAEPVRRLQVAARGAPEARRDRLRYDRDVYRLQRAGQDRADRAAHRNDAHRLIEECMLAANVCAADFLKRNKHPGLYRVHAGPTPEKLENLRAFLRGVGLALGGGEKPHASDYAALMAQVRDRPDAQMLQTMVLRSMQQAVYSPDNIGHFGLAYEAYAHFTSPIRRYPDLLTHRAIYAILQGKKYQPEVGHDVTLSTRPDESRARHAEIRRRIAQPSAQQRRDLGRARAALFVE